MKLPATLLASLLASLATSVSIAADWPDFRAIVWQQQKPESCAALKAAGIDAVAYIAEDRDRPAEGLEQRTAWLKACGLSWYVENIATDFYSAYHRYFPDKSVNWRFVELKKAYRANLADPTVFIRDPSLSDPQWHAKIGARLGETVRAHRAYRPLYYALADEPGIADLSAFWDFDFSPPSLAGFRRWLEARYGSLAALNSQWASKFAAWDAVVPPTTSEAMKRTDGNFSAWADFKEWMDADFARAIALGTQAVHAADPAALAAIEGAQIPGWGGYDYSRLAAAVDAIELYDGGGNVEILRSLNPKLVMLTTSAEPGAQEAHQIWRTLLRGGRGIVFWDPRGDIAFERGQAVAPVLKEIKGGIAALLAKSERRTAAVAVLYSPASMRAQWMLDWQPKGSAWSDRDPGEVYEEANAVRASMTAYFDALGRAGLEPRVVTRELIEAGALDRGIRVLILPRALALSEKEAARIRSFVMAGGTLIAEGTPGLFDDHLRRLPKPPISDLFLTDAGKGKAILLDEAGRAKLVPLLAEAGVEPIFTLERIEGSGRASGVEAHLWRSGEA
ncbi:MAG TPA: alpha-amylase family protein, partial [Stellaceae bacterium]|nr:alpha-amylase family protein [Stellaceae bacterium]